jgi:hypothetical protein
MERKVLEGQRSYRYLIEYEYTAVPQYFVLYEGN